MALLRTLSDEDYWADYGVLTVRDWWAGDFDDDLPPGSELLTEGAVDAQPGGTIAVAGAGWLTACLSQDDRCRVGLEVHDGAPPDDGGDWDDVVETPYRTGPGMVQLTLLTGGDADDATLRLGPPGRYRVRVSCRRGAGGDADQDDGPGDAWRLQFWADPGGSEPPRWLARRGPAVQPEPSGWDDALDYDVRLVLWGAQRAAAENPDGASGEQIAAAAAQYRGAGPAGAEDDPAGARLGQPLRPPRPPPPRPTGDPRQDGFEAQIRREVLAEQAREQRELGEVAAQLGVATPVTVGEVIPLLVQAGLLTARDAGGAARYRLAPRPPRARDVLAWPAERAAQLEQQAAFDRYTAFAADLVAVARWTPAGRVGTVADLAGRLQATPGEVRDGLRYAARQKLLRVERDLDALDAPATHLRLTAAGRAGRSS